MPLTKAQRQVKRLRRFLADPRLSTAVKKELQRVIDASTAVKSSNTQQKRSN